MKLIHSSHQCRIVAPDSNLSAGDWLASMCDQSWRTLIDLRNWPMWIPGVTSAQQLGQESPARGTRLQLDWRRMESRGTIDHWEPPRGLCFSTEAAGGEIAFGFTIRENAEKSELLITIELERSLYGPMRLFAAILRWRLRRLGLVLAANLASRIRPSHVS